MSKLKNSLSHSLAAVLVAALAVVFAVSSANAALKANPKVTIIGDSYSAYEGYIPSGFAKYYPDGKNPTVDSVDKMYWKIFIDAVGGTLEVCNAWSGSFISRTRSGGNSDMISDYRLNQLGNPDVILLFAGTNDDWWGSNEGVTLGEGVDYTDFSVCQQNLTTVCGALSYMFFKLKDLHPDALVILIINSPYEYSSGTTVATKGLKPEFRRCMQQIAAYHRVPFVQLYDVGKDDYHPNAAGMQTIANQLIALYEAQEYDHAMIATSDPHVTETQIDANEYVYTFKDASAVRNFTIKDDVKLVEYLVVGGGGGGGVSVGGGGGGGGVRYASPEDVILAGGSEFFVNVGRGGAGENNLQQVGGIGDCSSVSPYFCDFPASAYAGGGGGGGSWDVGASLSGFASTGGSAHGMGVGTTAANVGLGHVGGMGNNNYGGGGGGAGATGYAGSASTHPGQGGDGVMCEITDSEVWYGAGGGGGSGDGNYGTGKATVKAAGGQGGGGAGAIFSDYNGTDGVDGLGGGGGGGAFVNGVSGTPGTNKGGDGGDGAVIIRLRRANMVMAELEGAGDYAATPAGVHCSVTVTRPSDPSGYEVRWSYSADGEFDQTEPQNCTAVGTYVNRVRVTGKGAYASYTPFEASATINILPAEVTDAAGNGYLSLADALKNGTPPFRLAKNVTLDPADVGAGVWEIDANGFTLTLLPSSSLSADYSGGILIISRLTNRIAIKPSAAFAEMLGADTLEDFPILVRLSESIESFEYDAVMEGGADLKFYDAADNRIPYEIELWDTTGTSYVWVKVPELAADTVIYVEYGDAATTDNDPTAVWSKYVMVVHGGSEIKNSAGSGLTAISGDPTTIPTTSECVVGGGIAKTELHKVGVNVQNPAKYGKLTSESQITVSCWHKATNDYNVFLFGMHNTQSQPGCSMFYYANTFYLGSSRGSGSGDYINTQTTIKLDKTAWHHAAFSYDWTTGANAPYMDGVKLTGTTANMAVFNDPGNEYWSFGSYANSPNSDNYTGDFDELRIYDGVASDKWVEAEYSVMASECFTYEEPSEVNLALCSVTFDPASPAAFTGSAIDVHYTVTAPDGETVLVEDTDYTASWSSTPIQAAGTYVLTLTAKSGSDYTGSKTATFVVTPGGGAAGGFIIGR